MNCPQHYVVLETKHSRHICTAMTNQVFSDIAVCIFDAYGTLFDVHSAVGRGGAPQPAKTSSWREKKVKSLKSFKCVRSVPLRRAERTITGRRAAMSRSSRIDRLAGGSPVPNPVG